MKLRFVKLISVILSLLIALSMMPALAWAEEDPVDFPDEDQVDDPMDDPEDDPADNPAAPLIQVDGVNYYDMTSAMNAAGPGSRVSLLQDVSLENQVDIRFSGSTPVTFDLDGYTITLYDPSNAPGNDDSGAENTGTGGVITLRSGSLTIVDTSGSEGGLHSLNASYPVIRLLQDDTIGTGLAIEEGFFRSDTTGLISLLDANGSPVADPDGQTLSVSLDGGTYDEQLPASFVADGSEMYQKEGGKWGIRERQEPVTHTVVWVNYDGTELNRTTVSDGESAVYEGDTPVRPEDTEFTYTFSGWDQDTQAVYGDMTVTAQYSQEPIVKYYVTFDVAAEGVPIPDGQIVRAGDFAFDPGDPVWDGYTFNGWFQDGSDVPFAFSETPIYADVVLHARWSQVLYTVTWNNYDGQMLSQTQVAPGQDAVYDGDTPTRPSDEEYNYTFSGWDPQPTGVTGDMTVTAQFTAEPVVHTFTVTWQNYDGAVLYTASVDQGTAAVYEGETPVRPDDESYTYTFSGWDTDTSAVQEDTLVTALYDQKEIVYTVSFDLNHDGAQGQPDPQQVAVGQTAVKPEDPTAPDAVFTYWTAEADPEAQPLEYDFSAPVNADLTLYGYWTVIPVFTVTFDANGGSGEMAPVTVDGGTSYTLPECGFTAPEGKRFSGWDLGAVGTAITVNADMTAVAQWEDIPVETCTVTFAANGGSGTMDVVTVDKGASFTLPECAFTAPEGKQFSGWDLGAVGTAVEINADTTVTAQWEDIPVETCTVTFAANGGSGTMDVVTVEKGASFTLPECAFTAPDGKRFSGWDLGTVGTAITVNADTTVTAQWEDIPVETCTVSFDANGGSGTMDVVTVEKGASFTLPACGFTAPDGKRFSGWDLGAVGTAITVNADTTVTAQWEDIPVETCTVSFDANGGSGTMDAVTVNKGATYTLPACAFTAPDWMRFKAWKLGEQEYVPGAQITVPSDIVISAVWEEIPVYTITFHSNGGGGDMSAVKLHEGTAFILPACAFTPPAGKVFAGWDRGPVGTEIIMEGDLELNALWTNAPVVKCTISFDANGGSGTMASVTVDRGAPFTIPANGFTAPSGKTFAGWDKGIPGSIITVAEDTVLKALWTEQPTTTAVYSVTFYTAHGNTPVGQLVKAGQKVVKPADPIAAGYLFRGWYTEIEYTNSYDFNAPVSKNLTLYAKWEEEQTTKQFFTVAFFNERGAVPAQQSIEKGLMAAKPADPYADGYVFQGWYTEKECKTLYDFNTPVTANLTLFAGWAEAPKQSFVVYFQSNGHGNTPNPQPVQSGQLITKPQDPVAFGYTFTGWFTDQAATTAFNFDSAVTSDITLYAGWTPNRYTVRFDSNEGTGTMASLPCTYDIRAALPADTFTRSGYKFTGWNTKADGSGITYNDKAVILNLTDSNGGTVPLYAQWKNLYSVIEGINAVVPKDGTSGVTFRVDGDYNKFTGITIDGQTVPMNQYTSWEGSTYVRLNQDYVNKLAEGDHTVKFQYTDGSVETNFDVVTGTPAPTPKPRTNSLLLWIIIIVIILAAAICTLVVIRLRRRNGR